MKKLKASRRTLKGYQVKVIIDGDLNEFFLTKKKKSMLKEFLDKNRLKGVKVSYSEVYE